MIGGLLLRRKAPGGPGSLLHRVLSDSQYRRVGQRHLGNIGEKRPALKRDMELVRQILMKIEADESAPGGHIDLDLPDRSPAEISYHVRLLEEAGLIEAISVSNLGAYEWEPVRLTWEGHEFLDAARSNSVWNAAKERVAQTVGTVPVDVLKKVLEQTAGELLGLS